MDANCDRLKLGPLEIVMKFLLPFLAGFAVLLAGNAHAAGFQFQAVPDPDDRPISVGIWYPSRDPASRQRRLDDMTVAMNGALSGTALPLVVISHGTGGGALGHNDTAIALADAGFVVAAPTHTGDNFQDESSVGTQRWLTDRPRHIRRVIDYMLSDWHGHTRLDPRRIGFFGFSAGGFTGLIVVGATPDLSRFRTSCANEPLPDLLCGFLRQRGSELLAEMQRTPVWLTDERVRAAVLAAPGPVHIFTPDATANVKVPLQLWTASLDISVPEEGVVEIARRLSAEHHSVQGAEHLAFLRPCNGPVPICMNPPGFDRAAFHETFNKAVVDFFMSRLPR
jgi:predicted dienelactone hydrolase